MKSKVIIIALCAAAALIFFGCGKDNVYNPSQKISKIYSSSTNDPEKELDEIWEWNGETLAAIYWDEDKSYGFKFGYDDKNRVTKVSMVEIEAEVEEYLKCTYDGKEIDKVEYCVKAEGVENVMYRMTYEYSGGKIVKMVMDANMAANGWFAPKKAKKLLSFVLPKKAVERLPNNIATKADGGYVKYGDLEWTWKKDNVIKVKFNYYNEDGSIDDTDAENYQYDTKNSPYYNFTSSTTIMEGGIALPSKNNIIRSQGESSDNYSTYEIKYNNKDYPTEITSKYSGDEFAWTTYYEYK